MSELVPSRGAVCAVGDLSCRFDELVLGPLFISIVLLLPCARCFAKLRSRAGATDDQSLRFPADGLSSEHADGGGAGGSVVDSEGDQARLISSSSSRAGSGRPPVLVLWSPSLLAHVAMASGLAIALLCDALDKSVARVSPAAGLAAGLAVVGWGVSAWRSKAAFGRERAVLAAWVCAAGAAALARGALAVVSASTSGTAVWGAVVLALWGCVGGVSGGLAAWSLAGRAASARLGGGGGAAAAPEEAASALSRLTFTWLSPLMRLGYARPLEQSDLPVLASSNSAVSLARRFDAAFAAARAAAAAGPAEAPVETLTRAFVGMFGGEFAKASLLKLVHDILQVRDRGGEEGARAAV